MVAEEWNWKQMQQQVYGFLRRRVGTDLEAEDLTQDVLLKVHRHLQQDGQVLPDNLTQWLYRITRNTLIDSYRRKQAPLPVDLLDEEHSLAIERTKEVDGVDGVDGLEREVASWLAALIDQLPDTYQEAVRAVDVEGMSQKQYAAHVGISYSGAKSRVQRGRQILKERLLACCQFAFDRRGGILDATAHTRTSASIAGCCDTCHSDPV